MPTPESGEPQAAQRGMSGIAEQMRHALSELRRGDVSEAARQSDSASSYRRRPGGADWPRRQALGELQLEAQRWLGRQMAADTRHAGADPASRRPATDCCPCRLTRGSGQDAARVGSRTRGVECFVQSSIAGTWQIGCARSDQLRRTTSGRVRSGTRRCGPDRRRRRRRGRSLERVVGQLTATGQLSATAQRLSDREAQADAPRTDRAGLDLEGRQRPATRGSVQTQDTRPGGAVVQPGG